MLRPTLAIRLSVRLVAAVVLPLLTTAHPPQPDDGLYAEIETAHGLITARLHAEAAPLTVTNFVGLAEGTLGPRPGQPYFDGVTFHRVVPGFVVQGGDPRGDGEGGPGYSFPDEFSPALRHDRIGILSMANDGPDSNGSQFFITLAPLNRLNYLHSVFGEIVDGLDLLPAITEGDTMQVRIRRVGATAEAFVADQATFDALIAAAPKAHPAYLDDPDQVLPQKPDWARILGLKLANFHRFGGASLHVLLRETCPPVSTGPELAADLARRADITDTGLAAVYLADTQQWHLAPGTATAAQLTGGNDDTIETLLATIRTRADEALQQRYGENPIPPEQGRRAHLDALIDTFIPYLEPQGPSAR